MRTVMLLPLAAALACGPIYSPSGCPKPCPLSCANSCLPSGYCKEVQWAPVASPPVTRNAGDSLALTLGDLPPDAQIALSIHSVVDLVGRDRTIPWDYWIDLALDDSGTGVDVLDASAFNGIDFPIVGDWAGQMRTSAAGELDLQLNVVECESRAGRLALACMTFLPATLVKAQLIDDTPWEVAPPCQ